jgi:hypothetical protein
MSGLNRITRRTLVLAGGTASVLAVAPAAAGTPQGESSPERRGKDRAFLADEPLRNVVWNGRKGFQLKVRLTSYRSLPLSCIEGIRLKVDGNEFEPKNMVLTLNNYSHTLDELPKLSRVWWFILDYADLFVASETPLTPGEHDVEGTLITVEPYMTAGRFSFYSQSRKRLALEEEAGRNA